MLDLTRIEAFQWDAGNNRKGDKHGVSPAEAEQVFFNYPILSGDLTHSLNEPRYHALGVTDEGRLLHVTFTLRGDRTLIRVISARPMNRKERAHYEEKT